MKKFTFFIFLLSYLLITNSSLLITNCSSQWLRQDVPVNFNDVYDLKFFDSNFGLMSTYPFNLYRTTNGGNNWILQNIKINVQQMQIIDSTTLFGCGAEYNGYGVIYKTFNKGLTWDSVGISSAIYTGISFVNKDTGWVSAWTSQPVIFRTTNGGLTLVQQTNQFGNGKIFFLKNKINGEYYGWANETSGTWKSTNSGNNWSKVTGLCGANKIFFINENSGWQVGPSNVIIITTNGGSNWLYNYMPSGNGIINNIYSFEVIKNDSLLGTGASRQFPNNSFHGIIWKSTNGGLNWNYQLPDTSYQYPEFDGICFIDSVQGWSSNIHTTNAGGPIFVTAVNTQITNLPDNYKLEQNYPNPFNSETVIEFSVPKKSNVSLTIYDMLGREVIKVYNNEYIESGYYKTKINFDKAKLAGGIYFYRLTANSSNTNFIDSKKLIYIK
jgi:photosystem II stability/assembly factor-like uncharacterized protein